MPKYIRATSSSVKLSRFEKLCLKTYAKKKHISVSKLLRNFINDLDASEVYTKFRDVDGEPVERSTISNAYGKSVKK